jgi:hypothetical protein
VTAPNDPPPAWASSPAERDPWLSRTDLLRGGWIIAVLAVVGAPVGVLWQAISPHTVGVVVGAHAIIPDETETFIASDGRFALLTGAVGALAAVVAWLRPTWRGPSTTAAVTIGGLAGSLVASWVGRLTGGGHADGKLGSVIALQVAVRSHAILVVEPLASVWLICLFALFAKQDDLRRAPTQAPARELG